MEVHLSDLGKKFNREWLFQNISYTFNSGESYALTGPNGSGKSTLLQIIGGNQLSSAGKIHYSLAEKSLEPEDVYQHLVISAPYLELIEEFTLQECLEFHFRFKQLRSGLSFNDLITLADFNQARNKYIKNFSSGMKQRLKLLLTFYSETSLILLDEPTTNLDEQGILWYLEQAKQKKNTLMIVASNQEREYSFCQHIFSLTDYKGE
jgi:ABC-type multidrug transport system ATPase subunit